MELYCAEVDSECVPARAYADPVFLKDDRVLQNLMKLEEFYTIPSRFMDLQTDIKPYMRKIVTQWMLEVCEEQQCEEDVFVMAINFLDRFLALTPDVKRNRLQLLATACIFIASKLKETYPLPSDKLVIYTDYSITAQELLDWELLILSKLKWDISPVVATDFVDILLDRLRLPVETAVHVRKHTLAYISLCSLDDKCVVYPPSMIACGCISAAIENLTTKWRSALYSRMLHDITGLDLDCLRSCQEHVQRLTGTENRSPVKGDKSQLPGTPTETLDVQVN